MSDIYLKQNRIYFFYSRHKGDDFSIVEWFIFLGQRIRLGKSEGYSHTGNILWCEYTKQFLVYHSRGTGLQITPYEKFIKNRDIPFLQSFSLGKQMKADFLNLFYKYNDKPYDKGSIINFAARVLLHRNVIKKGKDEAIFCSEWTSIVAKNLFLLDIVEFYGLKSREYVSPSHAKICLDALGENYPSFKSYNAPK